METQAIPQEIPDGKKTMVVKIDGSFLRDLFDVPAGVFITGAFMDDGCLALVARGYKLPDSPHQTTNLTIRQIRNRRGQIFDVVLWPGYAEQTLEEYGLTPS